MRWTRRVTESVFWLERNVMSIAKQLGAANSASSRVWAAYLYTNTQQGVRVCVGGCVCQFDCVLPASCQFHCQDIEARKLVYRKSGFGQGAIAVAGERQAEVRWVTVGCGVVWCGVQREQRRLSAGNTRKLYVAGAVWICRCRSKIEIDGRLSENLNGAKSISKLSKSRARQRGDGGRGSARHEVSSRLAPLHVSNMLNITDLVVVMVNPVVAQRLRPLGAMPEDLCPVSVCVCLRMCVCVCLLGTYASMLGMC